MLYPEAKFKATLASLMFVNLSKEERRHTQCSIVFTFRCGSLFLWHNSDENEKIFYALFVGIRGHCSMGRLFFTQTKNALVCNKWLEQRLRNFVGKNCPIKCLILRKYSYWQLCIQQQAKSIATKTGANTGFSTLYKSIFLRSSSHCAHLHSSLFIVNVIFEHFAETIKLFYSQ